MSEIRIISTTAMKTTFDALAAAFEARWGFPLACEFGPSGRMQGRVGDGAACDVAVVSGEGIDDLTIKGRIVAGTRTDIGRSSIGVAVQKGAPRPDISTVEGFRAMLLGAKAIATSNPAGGAASGLHLAKVFERLGIAEALKGKLIYGPGGPAGLIGNYLLRGEVDVGLQQLPELRAVPGIEIVGPLPDEIQLTTTFSAGLSTAATNVEGARELLAFLKTPAAVRAVEAAGMDRA